MLSSHERSRVTMTVQYSYFYLVKERRILRMMELWGNDAGQHQFSRSNLFGGPVVLVSLPVRIFVELLVR
jgi:hypothetical protein